MLRNVSCERTEDGAAGGKKKCARRVWCVCDRVQACRRAHEGPAFCVGGADLTRKTTACRTLRACALLRQAVGVANSAAATKASACLAGMGIARSGAGVEQGRGTFMSKKSRPPCFRSGVGSPPLHRGGNPWARESTGPLERAAHQLARARMCRGPRAALRPRASNIRHASHVLPPQASAPCRYPPAAFPLAWSLVSLSPSLCLPSRSPPSSPSSPSAAEILGLVHLSRGAQSAVRALALPGDRRQRHAAAKHQRSNDAGGLSAEDTPSSFFAWAGSRLACLALLPFRPSGNAFAALSTSPTPHAYHPEHDASRSPRRHSAAPPQMSVVEQ